MTNEKMNLAVDAIARLILGKTDKKHCKAELEKILGSVDNAGERNVNLKTRVSDTLHQIGMPAHIKGYHYVREAIMLAVKEPEYLESITRMMYPTIAKTFDTIPSRVERAIRHAVEVTWDRGDLDVLQNVFGSTISPSKGKPSNSEFIALIADRIALDQE